MNELRITEAARRLGVSRSYLRILEKSSRIPPARRDRRGRVYSELDITILKLLGVGSRPARLKELSEVLGASSE